MAIEQYLSNIRINGGPPGIAFGGYIFSARSETGFTSSPSKCTIRIVLKDSPNQTEPIEPSLVNGYVLSINNYSFYGYLLESTVEKTVGETILNMVFCDNSIILDQNVIGLTYRAAEKPGSYGNLHVIGAYADPVPSDQQIECLDCLGNILPIDNPYPITTSCTAKDVYYTGADFKGVLARIAGGDIGAINSASSFSHIGSVREVLNSICSDLGLTWYWDWTTNKVNVINSGVEIPAIDLQDTTIISYSKTSSKEGTFSSSSNSYSVDAEQVVSHTLEDYRQVVLSYDGDPTVNEDVVCGVLAQMSKDLRDDYCYGRGMWYRLGFSGTIYAGPSSAGGFQFIDRNLIKNAAKSLGDQALWDLASNYSFWYKAIVNPELRSYWEAREAGAVQNYGKKYKVSSGGFPDVNPRKECRGDFSIDVSYERYPDFDNAGNWQKQVGISMPPNDSNYKSQFPAVVIPLIGQLARIFGREVSVSSISRTNRSPITNTNAFSFLSEQSSSSGGLSLIGWAGKPYGNFFGNSGTCANPDEEPLTRVNSGADDSCPLGCEKEKPEDICKTASRSCANFGEGILQGMSNPNSWCYGGVILPSVAPFYGWVKRTQQASRLIKNPAKVNSGSFNSGDVKEARYQSIDITKTQGTTNRGQMYSLAKSLSIEYAGIKETPIVGGLTSFSYIIDSNGAFTSVHYNSRPQESPKPDPVLGKVIVKKLAW